MSGGSYDYAFGRVDEFAELLESGTTWTGRKVVDPHPSRLEFAKHLRKVAAAMEAIEWVDSYDRSPPADSDAIAAVLATPLVASAAVEAPRKRMTWSRDEDESEGVISAARNGDISARNSLLERAIQTLAVGYTHAPSGKRQMRRDELIEMARALCLTLGISWDGLVDLDTSTVVPKARRA